MKKLVLLAALAVAACAPPPPPQTASSACAAPLKPALELSLFFGRGIPTGGEVSDAQWARFVTDDVTPHFPDGLSVLDVAGQYRDPSGRIGRERTKLLVVVVVDAPAHRAKVQAIVDAYNKRFGQHAVFRTEQPVCAGV